MKRYVRIQKCQINRVRICTSGQEGPKSLIALDTCVTKYKSTSVLIDYAARHQSGAPNENIVQNHLKHNINERILVFKW